MPRTRDDLAKKTLNFRSGDFEKMGQLFPDLGPSKAVRVLLSKFVDRHYETAVQNTDLSETDIDL